MNSNNSYKNNLRQWELSFVLLFFVALSFVWYMNIIIANHIMYALGESSHVFRSMSATSASEVANEVSRDFDSHNEDEDVHIAFSTGCNAFQDWQSYLLFYNIWKSGQAGHVTRIASGCSEEESIAIRHYFQKYIIESMPTASERFHLHLTPDYSKVHIPFIQNKAQQYPYKFFNKPYGLKHWMEHELGFLGTNSTSNTTIRIPNGMANTMFIILDPDQIILKPFKRDYTHDPYFKLYPPEREQQHSDNNNEFHEIRQGHPYSQLYLFGGGWIHPINNDTNKKMKIMNAAESALTIPTSSVHNETQNEILTWTPKIVDTYYAAGPPYIAISVDMYNIVSTWAAVAVPVYEYTNDHLSEMFAYSTAAAYLNLRHQLVTSMMISHPGIHEYEGWSAIDAANTTSGKTTNNFGKDHNVGISDYLELTEPHYDYNPQLPEILHYCQRYYIGPYFFSKYRIPKNILSCESKMLLVPPSIIVNNPNSNANEKTLLFPRFDNYNNVQNLQCGSVAFLYNSSVTPDNKLNSIDIMEAKRQTFFLCQIVTKFNDAVTFWKNNHCNNINSSSTTTTKASSYFSTSTRRNNAAIAFSRSNSANYEKTFVFSRNYDNMKDYPQEVINLFDVLNDTVVIM